MRVALLLLSLAWITAAQAQTPDLSSAADAPLFQVPAPVTPKSLTPSRKGQPLIIGRGVPYTLSLDQGRWDQLPDGSWRWRARMQSAGAVTLSFEFSEFQMPEGGQLWIYDPQGHQMRGPYTQQNQTPEGRLWTPLTGGDSAIIEAHVPAAARDALKLKLAAVNYGDVDIFKVGVTGHTAGACTVNVACTQGDLWNNEKRATVLITASKVDPGIGYEVLCSAVMVNTNNVAQDSQPYLLTANHCHIRSASTVGSDGDFAASSVNVYWLYQSNSCNGTTTSNNLTNTGTTFVFTDDASDHTLLRLNNAPVAGANVYLSGWDASGSGASCGAGLHHPQGDIKKISLFSAALTQARVNIGTATPIDAWKVSKWISGTTEEGSSGSGLWNQDHRIVGVLTAGNSACSSTNPNVGNGQSDFYGRMNVAWSDGLQSALDPGNTSGGVMCGRNLGDAACSGISTGGSCTVTTTTTPAASSGGGSLSSLLLAILLGGAAARRFTSRRASSAASAA